MTDRYYTLYKLLEAFNKAGMPVTCWWVYKQEEKGNLKLLRSTTNFKKAMGTRKAGAVRMIRESQIKEIVKAFLPGGRGYWSFEKSRS